MNRMIKKLREENNLLDQEIRQENQEIFTDMICYLRGSDLSEYDIEVVRRDLTDMVLSAQQRGESISSVINGDYKEFCDEIIKSMPPKSKFRKFVDNLDICCWGLSILIAINILFSRDVRTIIGNAIKGKSIDFNISVSIGNIVLMLLILILANWSVNATLKNVFRRENTIRKMMGVVLAVLVLLSFIIIAWMGRNTLLYVNFFAACIIAAALFAGHKLLERM